MKEIFTLPHSTARVTITGGEPLLQRDPLDRLVDFLNYLDIPVSIETNGTLPIPYSWNVASWVVDCKLPGSGTPREVACKYYESWVTGLRKEDFIKFVITNRADFDEAVNIAHNLKRDSCRAGVAFSAASANVFGHTRLLEWLKEANLTHAILNVQIHKILFPGSGGGRESEV